MAKQTMYYAVYDISSNTIRNKAIIALKNAGMTRVQKSVFCGGLTVQQRKDLIETLKQITEEQDSVYLIRACNACFGKITIIGAGFDKKYVSGKQGAEVL